MDSKELQGLTNINKFHVTIFKKETNNNNED